MPQVNARSGKRDEDRKAALAAADRLLEFQLGQEKDVDFARRFGITPQNITGWRKREYGLSIGTLAQVATRLSDPDLLYVVTGRRSRVEESETAAYARGVLHAFAAVKDALGIAERELSTSSTISEDAKTSPGAAAVVAGRKTTGKGKGSPPITWPDLVDLPEGAVAALSLAGQPNDAGDELGSIKEAVGLVGGMRNVGTWTPADDLVWRAYRAVQREVPWETLDNEVAPWPPDRVSLTNIHAILTQHLRKRYTKPKRR